MAKEMASIEVVASFSVLADMVANVGGDRVRVRALVGAGRDAHVYRPSPHDIRQVGQASTIFINGAGFEAWFERLIAASTFSGEVVTVTKGLMLRPLVLSPSSGAPAKSADLADRHGLGQQVDPHGWHDPRLALGYVANIERGLAHADPSGAAQYAANAKRYQERIKALYRNLRHRLAGIGAGRNRLITPHPGFGHFAEAFALEIIPAAPAGNDAEVSAAQVVRLIRMIKRRGINAVLTENISDPRLMVQIARETGVRLGGPLYSDALSPATGPAATYVDMLRYNVVTIADLLIPATGSRQ